METKRKKKWMNVVMILLILVIAASGVLTVGKIQGWFEKAETAEVLSGTIRGIANIQRQGIGYTLNQDTVLRSGDLIETKNGAQAELCWKENGSLILHEKTETALNSCEAEESTVTISRGEVFGDMLQHTKNVTVVFADHKAALEKAVFDISVQTGSSSLNLYAGDVSVLLSDGTQERVEAGECLSVTEDSSGSISYQIQKLQAEALNEFQITQAQNCSSADSLCFTAAELQKVLDDRAAEKQAALEAALRAEKIQMQKETETELLSEEEISEAETSSEAQQQENSNAPEASDPGTVQEPEYVEQYTPQDTTADQAAEETANICTITIRCDTILENMENLDDGKEAYVPANGLILATSRVEFEEGETVFDVLNRVCEYAGIQIEYSWTPMYNSYYIEGLNNLYEFDCGNESGWMYKVNGWFPNYGCSSYTLEDGDDIVWCYTCNGLGADVGAPAY